MRGAFADSSCSIAAAPLLSHLLPRKYIRNKVDRDLKRAEILVQLKDRSALRELARSTGAFANMIGNRSQLNRICTLLQRLCIFDHCWPYRIAAESHGRTTTRPHWDGGMLIGKTVLLRSNMYTNRIGEDIRFARFIDPVDRSAQQCIVCTERRLMPILRRTYPRVKIVDRSEEKRVCEEADVVADFGTLGLHFAATSRQVEDSFRQLVPSREVASDLRRRYEARTGAPVVGISWWSLRDDRDVPNLSNWAELLGRVDCSFVSLQYGARAEDEAALSGFARRCLIVDREVDPLLDLDMFAAQLAAMDAVVSISNTTIDMAAMLGVPTIQIRDDRQHGIWPPLAPTPWYPAVIPVYRNRRPWDEVMKEVAAKLDEALSRSASPVSPTRN